jgi:imidazoleglycerol-phosphate dehydratase/histidinol-phosphatase
LLRLKEAGYVFVMVTNQDGLGTASFPKKNFIPPHEMMLRVFESQGISFESIRICPHFLKDNCDCRKPKVGLVLDFLSEQVIDRSHSYVIGDRETDMQLAKNLGVTGLLYGGEKTASWDEMTDIILLKNREANITRNSKETNISLYLNLDKKNEININTGIGFFDHMLEQLAKHGGFSLSLAVKGDLHIDDHHTVEDTAIVLGEGMRQALGDKYGIGRYGYVLPMDESITQVALDLSGRSYFVFNGQFPRESVNDFSTELVTHFFRSFVESLKATLHIDVQGENTHHMIESIYKGVGRALREALIKNDVGLPSTKGIL